MKTHAHGTANFGDLVAAAFESAEQCSPDPVVVSRIAVGVVSLIMRRRCKGADPSTVRKPKTKARRSPQPALGPEGRPKPIEPASRWKVRRLSAG